MDTMEKRVRVLETKDVEARDNEYWKSVSGEHKLDILQYLREMIYPLNREDRKGLQRVYRIVEHP